MRRFGRDARLALGAAVLLISGMIGMVAFAGPASAAATLTVTPNTGLAGGTVVSVVASGYPASTLGAILECNNASPQPTITFGGQAIPVSCTNPITALHKTDASGNLTANFTIVAGTTGPPAKGTDSSGGDAATDAANYPCPPTAAQLSAGFSCVIAYGVSSTPPVQATALISFPAGTVTTTTTTTTTIPTTTTTLASCIPASATSAGPPSLTANPGTCLNGGTVVTLTGSGYDAGSAGAVLECNNASGQPTVALPAPISQSVPVSCTGIAGTALITTDATGALPTSPPVTFTIASGTTGPPCGVAAYLAATCPATDSAGQTPSADAANYPCPPTAAQIAAGASCVLAFGDAGGKQGTVNISFVPAPTPAAPVTAPAATAAATTTTAAPAPVTSASTLAFTGAGPGLWFTLLGGLLLLDLGYLLVSLFYRPRDLALRVGREIRRFAGRE